MKIRFAVSFCFWCEAAAAVAAVVKAAKQCLLTGVYSRRYASSDVIWIEYTSDTFAMSHKSHVLSLILLSFECFKQNRGAQEKIIDIYHVNSIRMGHVHCTLYGIAVYLQENQFSNNKNTNSIRIH